MAEEQATEEEEAPKKGGMKTIVMYGGILLVAVGASIGGTLFFLGGGEEAAPDAEAAAPPPIAATKALYHNLRPPFVVNFLAGDKPRYLQADLTVLSRNEDVIDSVITHTPLVRARIIDFVAGQDYLDLQTTDGKEAMRAGLVNTINTVLTEQEGAGMKIESVLYSNFVMQ